MSNQNNLNFARAMSMLDSMSVDDLIIFWRGFGPCRMGPSIERTDPWYKGLPGFPAAAA